MSLFFLYVDVLKVLFCVCCFCWFLLLMAHFFVCCLLSLKKYKTNLRSHNKGNFFRKFLLLLLIAFWRHNLEGTTLKWKIAWVFAPRSWWTFWLWIHLRASLLLLHLCFEGVSFLGPYGVYLLFDSPLCMFLVFDFCLLGPARLSKLKFRFVLIG